MGVSAGVAAGGAVIGAGINYFGSQNAANTEANAANNATATDLAMFQQEQRNAAPFLQAGQTAEGQLMSELPNLQAPFTTQQFHESPGYQWQLGQGEQAMQRSAAASGLLDSVGTQQGLNNYAQGAANTDYQQALQNYMGSQQQRYNMLSGIVGQGVQAAGLSNSAAQSTASNITANTTGAANAQAAGQVGTANAISGGISNAGNGLLLSNLLNKGTPQSIGYGAGAGFTGANLNGSSQLSSPMLGDSAVSPQLSYLGD